MRKIFMLSSAVLLLASSAASAQQSPTAQPVKPGEQPAAAANQPAEATISLGYRTWSIDGDEARIERFRDLQPGVVLGVNYFAERGNSGLSFNAANVARTDQFYQAELNNYGKFKATALWSSIPLNYAYNTLTPWVHAGDNVFTLDAATRTLVQNKTPGVLGIGTNAAAYNTPSVYRGLASPFELASRRDILKLGLDYQLTEAFKVDLGFNTAKRGGNQPYGAAFAFNDAAELPIRIDDRSNDITAAVEWAKSSKGMLRLEWMNSKYTNQFQSLTWDNPLRATDFSNGKAPPAGPYDASGYSNGNGPATGRLALAPSSSMNTLSLTGLHRLPGRTTINGNITYANMKQDDDLIPWTTNANIANQAVYALFPGLAQLPRSSAQAEVRAVNAALNVNMRPTNYLALDMRYRFNDRENLTPYFDASNNVRFDAVPEAVPGTHTKHYNVRRNTFETGATFTIVPTSAVSVGYILEDVKREGRVFGGMTDYTLRLSFDMYGNQLFSVRTLYENTQRKGSGFNELELEHGGAQPGLRFFDEAELGRNKATLMFQLTPSEKFDVGVSLATISDDYNGEEHEFGLIDNSNTSYNVSVSYYPFDKVAISGNYGHDKYSAKQEARNANPFSGVANAYESWNDVNRNWALDNDETVKTFGVAVDLLKALPNTDLRINYDLSKSDNAFVYGGPRIQELSTNVALTTGDGLPCGAGLTSCFSQLPNVTNKWQQLNVNLTHLLGKKLGFGLGYSYEKFDINDWQTRNLDDGSPRIDPLGEISTGYGNRPYEGHIFTMQLNYTFKSMPFIL